MREFRSIRKCESLHRIQIYSKQDKDRQLMFEYNPQNRRQSCHCNQCGRLSEFQIRSHDVQMMVDMPLEDNRCISSANNDDKRLQMLEGRIKTFQDEPYKFELLTRIRRKSCYCQECGILTEFENKNQNIPYFHLQQIVPKAKNKLSVRQQQTKSKFYFHTKQLKPNFLLRIHSQQIQQKTTQRQVKLQKLILTDCDHRLNLQQKLAHSPLSEQLSPTQGKCSSLDSSPKNSSLTPYPKIRDRLLSPSFKLPHLNNCSKIDFIKRQYFGLYE